MRFQGPHVGVVGVGVQPIAVGLALPVQHQVLQLRRRQFPLLPFLEDVLLEDEAAGDVHHHLASVLQGGFQDGDLLLQVSFTQRRLPHDGLAEDAGRFGQGHGGLPLQHRARGQVEVVIGVPQLVGQRAQAAVDGLVVGEHARLVVAQPHAEGAIHFAGAGLGVYPALAEGPLGQSPQLGREGDELLDDELRRLFVRPFPDTLSHGGEHVIPGQGVQAQGAGLGPQVASEVGERFVRRFHHGVQRLAVHVVYEQHSIQRRVPSPPSGQNVYLALDAVQGRGEGRLGALPGGDLGLVGAAAHLAVGVVGQVAHGAHGQRLLLAVQFQGDQQLRGEVAVQLAPGSAAGQVQLGGQRFFRRGHQVGGLLLGFAQHEGVLAGQCGALDEGCDVQGADPGGEAGVQQGELHRVLLILAVPGLSQLVAGVGGDEAGDVGTQGVRFLQHGVEALDHRFEAVHRRRVERGGFPQADVVLVEQGHQLVNGLDGGLKAGLEFHRFQAGIDGGHVPVGQGVLRCSHSRSSEG